ncbi:hypothetical protein [Bacillus sp. 2205SS5-2]|uniref:hypothetical protein n=1 Tax=Bacillus sp. 2205SS5-2 TaxID=3109031 RepID=UPI00300663E3
MDLEPIWEAFILHLKNLESIEEVYWKKAAGIPFLYIKTELEQAKLERGIKRCAGRTMKGFRLHCDTIFVRKKIELYVYRHRFYVPQEKMFCCGNLCDDCIRLR